MMMAVLAHEGLTTEQEVEMFEQMRGMMGLGGRFALTLQPSALVPGRRRNF